MSAENLYDGIPVALPRELTERLAGSGTVRVERIVSRGHVSAPGFWYDADTVEWVMVARGGAVLLFEDGERVRLDPGDHLEIAAHRRHRVEWTDPEADTVWVAVHYPAAGAPDAAAPDGGGDPRP